MLSIFFRQHFLSIKFKLIFDWSFVNKKDNVFNETEPKQTLQAPTQTAVFLANFIFLRGVSKFWGKEYAKVLLPTWMLALK